MKQLINTKPQIHTPQLEIELLSELREKAFARRPQLEEIINASRDMTLFDFSKMYNVPYSQNINATLKLQFIDTFAKEVERLLGIEVAASCARQLATTYRVTTTDHHGPISEPGMVNSNIHEALPYLNGDETIKNIIVLGCANVSFDNESFPRGLLFHVPSAIDAECKQLVFFSRSVRAKPVIYHPSYDHENLTNAKKLLANWQIEKSISENEKNKVEKILDDIYAEPSVMQCTNFSEQVTKTNYSLWAMLMKHYENAPKLVYIEQENIVNLLLLNYHLDQDTIIHRLLFTPKYHELIIKHFNGIDKCFSLQENKGTYLFWALPNGQKYRVQLWKKGNFLTTDDGSYQVPLTPEGIRNAINNKELIPSTLMSFTLLSFYYGVKLTGGTNQTTYLNQMKEAFINMQNEYGDTESAKFARKVPTKELSVALHNLAFLENIWGNHLPATCIDIILYGDKNTMSSLKEEAQKLTLNEVFEWALPDLYSWYYSAAERSPLLSNISKAQIRDYLGIDEKIIPIAIPS